MVFFGWAPIFYLASGQSNKVAVVFLKKASPLVGITSLKLLVGIQ